MTMNEDIKKYPIYEYYNMRYSGKDHIGVSKTNRIKSTNDYNHYTHNLHHFVEEKYIKKHPELKEELEKIQKLILMPIDMNMDIDKRTRNFKERWGIELKEVVYIKE